MKTFKHDQGPTYESFCIGDRVHIKGTRFYGTIRWIGNFEGEETRPKDQDKLWSEWDHPNWDGIIKSVDDGGSLTFTRADEVVKIY